MTQTHSTDAGELRSPRQWVGAACTLDGKPAHIAGRLCDFAVVWADDGSARFEWAWITVDRVMRRDAAFRS